ncbi:MAG: hypothetical protein AAFQ37_03510 [Bacteroidota bacterium]
MLPKEVAELEEKLGDVSANIELLHQHLQKAYQIYEELKGGLALVNDQLSAFQMDTPKKTCSRSCTNPS